ncbi:MAG TPA: hypothetical protein VMW65_01480 [Chloroflexota bacterium]|nr:hypothetical protein [Chloroflexota bacterium]
MRFVVLVGLLLVGLIVAGCGGAGHSLAAPSHALSIGATARANSPSTSHGGIDQLIKTNTSNATDRPTATPGEDEQTKGPLSCFDQRLQQLRQGDVLPTNGC